MAPIIEHLSYHAEVMEAASTPDGVHEPSPALTGRTSYLVHKAGVVVLALAEQALEPLGLRGRQYNILGMLALRDSSSQYELSQQLGLDSTLMVAVIDELERQGFAQRRRSQRDRRRFSVHITPKGRRALERADETIERVEADFLAPISATEAEQLGDMMRRLLQPHWPRLGHER